MKYKLLFYFFIAIYFLISCENQPNKQTRENKTNVVIESINALKTISDPDSLVYFAKQKDEQLQLLLSDSLMAEFRQELGVVFYQRSNYNVANDYFLKSEESYSAANLPLQATQMLANRAVINELRGNYKEAIAIYLQVSEYFKEQNDSVSWGAALGNIGVVYEEMGMADKAIYYDKLSLAINLVMLDTLRAASKYNNIGVAFSELKNNPDSAVYYYTIAHKIYLSNGNALHSAQVGNNLGLQYIILKKYDLAVIYLENAGIIFDSLNNIQGKALVLQYKGQLYYAQGKNAKAADYFEKAKAIFKQLDSKKNLIEIGDLLSNIYTDMRNYAQATKMMHDVNILKDSLMSVENKKIIADMESKYQLNEKNNTIEILQLKEELAQKQIKNQLVFIGFIIIVFLLLAFTYYHSVQKNKHKEKELRLELQNYMLRIDKLQIAADEKGNESRSTEEKLKHFELSDREIEVLKFIAKGYKNSEIAEKLFVSQNTIKTHIKNIYTKLNVRNRVEAIKMVDVDWNLHDE